MKINELREALRQEVGELGHGFEYRKDFYVKKGDELWHLFRVTPKKWAGWFSVETEVYLNCATINQAYNNILEHQIPVHAPTCGFGIYNVHRGRGTYKVIDLPDVPVAAAKVRSDFEEIALPFFDDHHTLPSVDAYLNKRSVDGSYKPMSVPWACLGLIAAKLVSNPDFERIDADYRKFCIAGQGEKLSEPLVIVKLHLG